MTELQSGVLLGRYELLVRIGRGGMASVWVARERSAITGTQRLVAVKAMLPELAAHSEFRAMFLREVQLIQAINHEHVVRVFEVSEDRGVLYMAMEWVEGESLRNVIRAAKTRGALPPEIAVRIAADAAAGLHAAHELRDWSGELRGVVHCDVSPHNILLGINGKAKLVDFGIANARGRLESSSDEQIKGKLSYMSPEQACAEKVDRRTDLFALGIVLFEMTTGEQLFKGRDAAHTLELVRHGAIPRPSHFNPRYPLGLETIVMRALDRRQDARFQTAAEFEQALLNFLYEERILVSHAAVAQLLMRVTGPRIEKRREVIFRILQAVDGQLQTGELGPHQLAAIADPSPSSGDPFNYTFTNANDEGALGIAARLESHTVVGQPPVHAMFEEEPVLIEPDSRSRAWLWLATAAAVLLVAAIAAYVLFIRSPARMPEVQTLASASAAPAAPPVAAVTPSAAPSEHVESAENLPVASESKQRARNAIRRPTRDRGAPKSLEESAIDLDAPASEPETPAPQPSEGAAEGATTTSTAPAVDEGINRVAANAALASASAAARNCRNRGDSPTGQGRAAVTFGPDGSAVAVNLTSRFSGTAIGECVAAHFRQAHAPPFTGDSVTLFYTFEIPQ
ncbi:MAG: serine/threonine-protein kinase [Myxococcales bacterium]